MATVKVKRFLKGDRFVGFDERSSYSPHSIFGNGLVGWNFFPSNTTRQESFRELDSAFSLWDFEFQVGEANFKNLGSFLSQNVPAPVGVAISFSTSDAKNLMGKRAAEIFAEPIGNDRISLDNYQREKVVSPFTAFTFVGGWINSDSSFAVDNSSEVSKVYFANLCHLQRLSERAAFHKADATVRTRMDGKLREATRNDRPPVNCYLAN